MCHDCQNGMFPLYCHNEYQGLVLYVPIEYPTCDSSFIMRDSVQIYSDNNKKIQLDLLSSVSKKLFMKY